MSTTGPSDAAMTAANAAYKACAGRVSLQAMRDAIPAAYAVDEPRIRVEVRDEIVLWLREGAWCEAADAIAARFADREVAV